jgi:hypothetical protein
MKKLIAFFSLSLLFAMTVFGPNWVQANLEDSSNFSALAPETVTPQDGYEVLPIHPAWQRLGLFPSCLD